MSSKRRTSYDEDIVRTVGKPTETNWKRISRNKLRGLIQVTGYYNYKKYGEILGVDLVNKPEMAGENTEISAKIAAAYWKENNLNEVMKPNTYEAFKKVTKIINGGYNGLEDRCKYWLSAKRVLGVT